VSNAAAIFLHTHLNKQQLLTNTDYTHHLTVTFQGRIQLHRRLLEPEKHAVHCLSPATGGLLAPAGGAGRLH